MKIKRNLSDLIMAKDPTKYINILKLIVTFARKNHFDAQAINFRFQPHTKSTL